MRKRRTLMKRLMSIVLVVVMIMTSQNLSGLVAAAAGEQVTTLELEAESYVPEVDLPDNDELFAGYVDREFYGETTTYGWLAGNRLENPVAYNLYDFLKTEIEAIANGTNASAVITFDPESLGAEATFENMSSDAAWAEFIAQFDMSLVFDALLHDCPYELYWFDKTTGMSYGCSMSATGSAPTYTTVTIENPYITFAVAGNYQPSSYDSTAPTVDTAITSATSTAVTNAKAIVTAYESLDDYNKLVAYRDKICELVSYDTAAANAGTFSQDNDPWQLIHVFDGDTNTNVVCEGYSKAFQYLCDMSTFEQSNVCSYIVTGTMTGGTGSGGHMWNIVTMDDGYNYLVDITNSDAGSIGQNGGLFLAGTTGDITNGYTFTIGSTGVRFTYDTDTTGLWGTDTDSILILADSDYVYTPTLDSLRIGEVYVVFDGVYDSTATLPSGVSYDHSTKTITLNNAELEINVSEYIYKMIEATGDCTLVLIGDNTITPVSSNASLGEDFVYGIDINGDLTISGTGSLTIDISGVNVLSGVYGIKVWDNMIINGGTINVITGDMLGTYNEAVSVEGNLTINAGTLNAVAGDALGAVDGYSYGIRVYKNMTVAEGASVNAIAGDATNYSYGLSVGSTLTSLGTISATSEGAGEEAKGIWATTMDINGGKVVATAGESYSSFGIKGDDFSIADAYIETQGIDKDIFSYYSYDVDNSVVVSRGQKNVAVYGEVALADDLEITSEYTFEYDNDATLTLGEYSIVLANGGTISDEALAGITDEAAMVTLADGTNIYYGDIQTALALGMEMEQSTLTLLANVSERLDITSGSGLTIDLNGYEIQTGNEYAVIVNASAKITIKDSSEAKSGKVGTSEFSSGIWNRGKLTLEGILCYGKYYAVSNSGDLYVNDSKLNDGASSFYNQGNVYVSGSSVINYDLSGDGKVYIAGALTDGASIEIREDGFNVVAYPAEGYTITDSDIAKFEHVNALDGYVIRVNEDGNAQVYGDLAKATLTIVPNGFDYSSEEQSITETVEFMGTILTKDTDYTVEGTSGTNAGEYTVTVTGTGNYVGEIKSVYNINAGKITVSSVYSRSKNYDGTTAADVDVYFEGLEGNDVLILNEDYTVSAEFEDSNVGDVKEITYTVTLTDAELAKNYTFEDGSRTYTGTTTGAILRKQAPVLTASKVNVAYGEKDVSIDITKLISGMPADAGEMQYLGTNMPDSMSMYLSEDGILTINEVNAAAGENVIVGVSINSTNYRTMEVDIIINIESADVSDTAVITIVDDESKYNGDKVYPDSLQIKVGDTPLVEGTDYDITYPEDIVTVGEKEIIITFKGNYTGSTTATYNIVEKQITPQIVIKDKQYDMETDAEIESVTLSGVAEGDEVSVSWENVTAEFEDANVENGKSVTLTGELTLTGDDAANYVLDMENVTVTGNIVNYYYAEEGVDYTVNSDGWINGWTNEDIVIKAMDGYKFAIAGITLSDWLDEYTVSSEGKGNISFCVKNSEGDVSNPVVVEAKLDKTAPTGCILINGVEFKELNSVSGFDLFSRNVGNIVISGNDANTDVSVEYYLSDMVLNELEVASITEWTEYSKAVELEAGSAKHVYAKLTDVAGNVTYISSTGVVVYTDSEAYTTEIDYTKLSDATGIVKVTLNGNTINKLYIVDDSGSKEEVSSDNYTIAGDTITINNTYLDMLETGACEFVVSYNPAGYVYVDKEGNQEPYTTQFTVNILPAVVTFTYGDANEDGKINVMDAVLMKKYIAGFENLKINLDASDVKVDGKINVMDAVLLLKYIAGFDVLLGE